MVLITIIKYYYCRHRMNCSNSAEEHLVSHINLTSNLSRFVSEFFF